MLTVKSGDKVRLTLLATTTDMEQRHRNGVKGLMYEGIAECDLAAGRRFRLITKSGELYTSEVQGVGQNIFVTQNSTYGVEKL